MGNMGDLDIDVRNLATGLLARNSLPPELLPVIVEAMRIGASAALGDAIQADDDAGSLRPCRTCGGQFTGPGEVCPACGGR